MELVATKKRMEQRVEERAEAHKRTDTHVDRPDTVTAELSETQKRREELFQALIARLDRINDRLGWMIGNNLERRYRERAFSYFGRILRRVQVVPLQDIVDDLERHLSEAEIDDLLPLDILVRGRARRVANTPEIWLALEVSAVVDVGDVERAQRRAELLRRAGYPAVPAVAGEQITQGGAEACRQNRVFLVQDGQYFNWDEAVAQVLTA